MSNPAKDKKNKEGREDNSVLLRRLMEEMASLRTDMETLKAEQKAVPALRPAKTSFLTDEREDMSPEKWEFLLSVDDADVARLAYAFASAQKVKIVRILLVEGALSSAQIGEKAGLTTGSLYHHLRELAHAEVIEPAGKNQHQLTLSGRRTAQLLFTQTLRR